MIDKLTENSIAVGNGMVQYWTIKSCEKQWKTSQSRTK